MFTECFFSGSQQRASLLSVKNKTLGKRKNTRKEKTKHLAKLNAWQRTSLPSVLFYTRQR
jgi:hypothetical protein